MDRWKLLFPVSTFMSVFYRYSLFSRESTGKQHRKRRVNAAWPSIELARDSSDSTSDAVLSAHRNRAVEGLTTAQRLDRFRLR
jgi:hypothetical protein